MHKPQLGVTPTDNIQSSFLEQIRSKLAPNLSFVDELAELLSISRDSAYRRIRGETVLSLDEVAVLTKHFSVSVDDFLSPSNDRVSFQAGAFLLFGHDAVLDELGTPKIGVTRIGVSHKKAMLEELDQLGINERTVFPYIENSARYIAQKFSFKR